MKKLNMKRIMMAGVAVLVLVVAIFCIGKSLAKPDDKTLKDRKIDGLSFENAEITYSKKLSAFTVDVYNENKDTYKVKSIDIILKNKDGNKVTLNSNLESKEGRKSIIEKIDYDLRNYTKVSYKINK